MTALAHPGDLLSRGQRLTYIVVLGALTALGPFTIDMYLPSLPRVQTTFDASTAAVQLTLTATTIGFALGQLLVGPWSDRIGRRVPLICATALHVIASVAVALAPNIDFLIAFRLVQGFGAAAGAVVAVATVRDLFGGYPMVRMLARLALVSGLAPVIAPLAGSALLLVVPWRGIFWVLAGYGLVVIVAAIVLIAETLPAEHRRSADNVGAMARYRVLFGDRQFVGVAVASGFVFTGLFAYLTATPFLFQQRYGFTPQEYGILFAANSVAIIIGVQTSAAITRRVGPQWIVAVATVGLLVTAGAIVLLDALGAGIVGIVVPLWLFILACGFCFPSLQALALAHHGREAGTAASVLGAANFGLAGLLSPLNGLFGVSNAIPMGLTMIGTSVLAIIAVWALVRPHLVPRISDSVPFEA